MLTFVVVLGPENLTNPDADLSVLVPQLIENYSHSEVQSLGWGYAPDDAMHFFFQASSRDDGLQKICAALESTPVKGNDLSSAAIACRFVDQGAFTVLHPPAIVGQTIADIDA